MNPVKLVDAATQGANAIPGTLPSFGATPGDAPRFSGVLEEALSRQGIQLTKHARQRMASREIQMNESDVKRIGGALDELKEKGGRISLLFMNETALVANVDRRTVITALNRYGEHSRVFTKIDSAAFIDEG